jgi:hypothetical protein
MRKQSMAMAEASVGFAADAAGAGLAYAVLKADAESAVLRVPFKARRSAALQGREIGYAALRAVADAVRRRHDGEVRFLVNDESLIADLGERRALPGALTMPYVALRCSLNRFAKAELILARTPEIGDLTARATAEVSLHVAA